MRTYEKNGRTYISVTEIVGMMFPFDSKSFEGWCRGKGINPGWVNQESRRLGTKVHGWLENRHLGIADWADSRPLTKSEEVYLKTTDEIMRSLKVSDMETTVFSDVWGYAGTYDIRLEDGTVVDVKTWGAWRGKYKRSKEKLSKVAVQLSMYSECLLAPQIAVCILLPDGGYEYEELKRDDSWKDWISLNRDKMLVCSNEEALVGNDR